MVHTKTDFWSLSVYTIINKLKQFYEKNCMEHPKINVIIPTYFYINIV